MRFVIKREALLIPLQHMVGVVEKRQMMPILSNVLLQVTTDPNMVSLTASNLEVELTETVVLENQIEEGSITVPAHKLLDITRVLPANSLLEIEIDQKKLIVQSDRSRFTLMTLPAKDYPNLQYSQNNIEFTTTQKELRFLIEHVYFAMAQQDVRYYLNGMLLEITKKHLRTVATDGHRLAMCTVQCDIAVDFYNCIVPRKAIIELLKLLGNDEQPVVVSIGENHIKINSSTITFNSKLIDAKFPNYETVLPRGGDKVIVVDVDEFKKILSRASIMSNEKFHGIKLSLRPGRLIVQAKNNEQEEAREEIELDYQGANLDIGFNVMYFLDVLGSLPATQVHITFSDDNSSALIDVVGKDSCLYVIMPMRL